MRVWTLANNTKHHSLFFTQRPLLLLVLSANWKGVCRLENWALFRRGLLWDYEESQMCATYTQSFCAWKAKSVIIYYMKLLTQSFYFSIGISHSEFV